VDNAPGLRAIELVALWQPGTRSANETSPIVEGKSRFGLHFKPHDKAVLWTKKLSNLKFITPDASTMHTAHTSYAPTSKTVICQPFAVMHKVCMELNK
jgi:hypothetical protein